MTVFATNKNTNGRNTNMLRKHFNAGTVVAIVALVFAMTGGAFAVTSKGGGSPAASIAKKKKSKAKVVKGPRGPKGETGPAGPAGPAGPQGPAGANGKDGAAGVQGKEGPQGATGPEGATGKDGATGKSVEVVPGEPASCNGHGGVTYEVEESGSPTAVCNGEPGVIHAGETLPKGASETGTWALSASEADKNVNEEVFVALSFPVELSKTLKSAEVVYVKSYESNATCKGSESAPTAPEGTLCVYEGTVAGATLKGIRNVSDSAVGANKSGALLVFLNPTNGTYGYGTWAVTG